MNRVEIIGYTNGNNPQDFRCLAHVDFLNHGPALWTGAEFSCTYCGDEYKDGLTEQQRYERKHNVKHCDNCLSYAAPFDGDKCAECVSEESESTAYAAIQTAMVERVQRDGIMVDIMEPGKAIIAGMGIIKRENGKYVGYADYLPTGETYSRPFSSYAAAARWMAREYGAKGKLTVHMHRDGA